MWKVLYHIAMVLIALDSASKIVAGRGNVGEWLTLIGIIAIEIWDFWGVNRRHGSK